MPSTVPDEVGRAFRHAHGPAIGTLIRLFGDIDLAEDAVQEAFTKALRRWPVDGVPANPAGWIVTTAKRTAVDHVRRAARGRELEQTALVEPADIDDTGPVDDDLLRLLFTCCHPALAKEHRVALTLRLLGGLTVEEVARALIVSEQAMAKRLVRAKQKIAATGIPYRIPTEADLPERLASVLTVISLIHTIGADDPERATLRANGLRLAREVVRLLPRQPEARGLLALILLTESRAATRRDGVGRRVPLMDQDRRLWDHHLIDEALALVRECVQQDSPGPYQLQASIQAIHASAPTPEATDWPTIVEIYDELVAYAPTAVVELNRSVAVAESGDVEGALATVEELGSQLERYGPYHSVRADLLERVGRHSDAADAWAAAGALLPQDAGLLAAREAEARSRG